MKGDSTDEFPIVGDEGIPNETNHDDSNLDETAWTDEFDVGSSQEFVSDAPPRSLFSRFLSVLPWFRASGRTEPHGMEIDDLQDVAEEPSARVIPPAGKLGGAERRVIDVKATDRRLPKSGAADVEDSALSDPSQSRPRAANATQSGESFTGRPSGFGSPGKAGSQSDPDFNEPHLEEFVFEKDDFLIVQSASASKRSAWLETISFPIVLARNILHRIFRGRDGTPDDEIEVATKRKLRGSFIPGLPRFSTKAPSDFGFDERSPDSSVPVESQTEAPDDFRISSETTAKAPPLVADLENQHQPQNAGEAGEDYQVATGSERRRTRFRPDFETTGDSAPHAGETSEGAISDASGPGTSQASTLSGRLESLLEYSSRDLNAVITDGPDSAGTPIEQDTQRLPAESFSIGRFLRRSLIWFLTIPKRCLTAEGDLQDQNRLKIEPLIASVPTAVAVGSLILSINNFIDRDRFESSIRYLKDAKANDAAGDRDVALLSSIRSCSESITPENHYEYAYLKTRSNRPEDVMLGIRLIRHLASPAGGNQPDAHLFIANEILRRSASSPELRQNSFPMYLAELRAGFEASPQRYDLLEKLAEGLTDRGEDQTLTNLITPYLDLWPLGHFFLAQAAFSRGDDILQKTHAFAIVRYFRGIPAELDTQENSRIRFVISLALAGEFAEASEMAGKFFGSDSNRELKDRLSERIKLIRLIARMGEFPKDSDRDIEALGEELLSGELSPLYESALKRQLLRKGPLRPALLDLCRKLHAERKASFDAADYVFWASILRQNDQNAEAREFLENAVKIDPQNDVAANNLANLLYKIEPYDLERALSLAQNVLSRNAENPIYLETRGQILARLGKDKEAIEDLGRCLVSFPEVPEIHEALADCYRKIGNEVLAKAHQDRFQELKAKETKTPTQPSP